MVEFIESKCDQNNKVRIIFDHPDLNYLISTPFLRRDDISALHLLNLVENVCQSKTTISVNETFKCIISIAKIPIGSGLVDRYLTNQSCVKTVFNSDKMCAIRAILIAIAYSDNDPKRRKLQTISSKLLEEQTLKVANRLNLLNIACTLHEIKRIEGYFGSYQITLYDDHGTIIYKGPKNKKCIYLWLADNHYNAITSITAFF